MDYAFAGEGVLLDAAEVAEGGQDALTVNPITFAGGIYARAESAGQVSAVDGRIGAFGRPCRAVLAVEFDDASGCPVVVAEGKPHVVFGTDNFHAVA